MVFSNLRPERVYLITGLPTGQINVDGDVITNPVRVKADTNGEATVTVYMKDSESAKILDLPENAIYTVEVSDYSILGYKTLGEVSNNVLKGEVIVEIIENNEISPPTNVIIKDSPWKYMVYSGICLLFIMIKFRRREDNFDERDIGI